MESYPVTCVHCKRPHVHVVASPVVVRRREHWKCPRCSWTNEIHVGAFTLPPPTPLDPNM